MILLFVIAVSLFFQLHGMESDALKETMPQNKRLLENSEDQKYKVFVAGVPGDVSGDDKTFVGKKVVVDCQSSSIPSDSLLKRIREKIRCVKEAELESFTEPARKAAHQEKPFSLFCLPLAPIFTYLSDKDCAALASTCKHACFLFREVLALARSECMKKKLELIGQFQVQSAALGGQVSALCVKNSKVLVGDTLGGVTLWDKNEKEGAYYKGPKGVIHALVMTADGNTVFSSLRDSFEIIRWNLEYDTKKRIQRANPVCELALSGDDATLVSGCSGCLTLGLHDVRTGELVRCITLLSDVGAEGSETIQKICLSHRGTVAAVLIEQWCLQATQIPRSQVKSRRIVVGTILNNSWCTIADDVGPECALFGTTNSVLYEAGVSARLHDYKSYTSQIMIKDHQSETCLCSVTYAGHDRGPLCKVSADGTYCVMRRQTPVGSEIAFYRRAESKPEYVFLGSFIPQRHGKIGFLGFGEDGRMIAHAQDGGCRVHVWRLTDGLNKITENCICN